MPRDPDHVLDAIDGVVDEWETLSADAMRWAPPEDKSDDLLREVSEIFGPLANALTQAFRPLGDAVNRVLDDLLPDDEGPAYDQDDDER
ncbi:MULTISPECIES: hypothetical protein [Nonomuraea]|uniref:WXG100 family type VII secretion target n=2 Tax=Nonomuraea TaxID=83681 RepID=A0ABW1C563_9ACTN|nr:MULTISPECIES: hypothetical protein [Nonomuraea]MDA0642014.1 hypothetical protein [Nonomuraea ferruginea]TXK35184.1 hypothetical protein FR742_38690 [Nonomuraea sp. C10]